MALDLNHTQFDEMLKQSAMDFMRRDAPKLVVEELLDTDTGFTSRIWKKITDMGWLGIVIPEDYGGTGSRLTSAGVLFESLGTGPLPGPYFSSSILCSQVLLEAGSEEQKKQMLPEVAEGRVILALALTEPEYSWEPRSVSTTAESRGAEFILNGRKLFVYDASAATHFIVAASAGGGGDLPGSMSLFLVDCRTEGLSVRRMPGFLSGRAFEVKLDAVGVPKSALLGTVNDGWRHLQTAMLRSIPVICAYKAGGCQAVFDMALEYSRTRIQFGQPIGRFQRVQDIIIEMLNHLDGARWTTYEALWKLDEGRPAEESVHLAKSVSSEGYWQICTLGHQVFSGLSYSMEHPLSFHTRTSRHLYNYLGDPSFHQRKLGKLLVPAPSDM
jgi:alkylation response protein AidB-like acyl-CoA dehydrogenase